jgi:hypothetical protein
MPSESQRLRCRATRRDGRPCTAPAILHGLCVGHSPGAGAARVKGGRATSKRERADKLLPARLRPILDRLERALVQVHEGDLSPGKASAMSGLAGAIVRVYQTSELEERLRALEQRAKQAEAEE